MSDVYICSKGHEFSEPVPPCPKCLRDTFPERQALEIATLRQRAETAERERDAETRAVALEVSIRDRMVKSLLRLADPLKDGDAAEWTETVVREIEQRLSALEAVAKAWSETHYARGDHHYSGIDVMVWLEKYVAALQPAAPPKMSEEQKAAYAKAIFDNDYTDMDRLKAPPTDAHDCTELDRGGPTYPREADFADPETERTRVVRIASMVREAVNQRTRECAERVCPGCAGKVPLLPSGIHSQSRLCHASGNMLAYTSECYAAALRRAYPEAFAAPAGERKEDEG